jgi:hypothetical protein
LINIFSTVYDATVDEFIDSYNTWIKDDTLNHIFVATQTGMLEENIQKISLQTRAIIIKEEDFIPSPLLKYNGWVTQQFRKLFFSTICSTDYYLCLDADTKYVNPLKGDDLFTEGQPNLYGWQNFNLSHNVTDNYDNYLVNGVNEPHKDEWYETNHRAHYSFCETTQHLLGHSQRQTWFLSGAFLMCCKTVRKLLRHIEQRYGSYQEAFTRCLERPSFGFDQGKLSEYTLYGTFVTQILQSGDHYLRNGCLAQLYFDQERAKNATSPFVTIHDREYL